MEKSKKITDWEEVPITDQVNDWEEVPLQNSEKVSRSEGPDTGFPEALLRGGAQGLSLGFADEVTAGIESMLSDKTYDQSLAESRAEYDLGEKEHEWASLLGNVVGGSVPALATGGALTAASKLPMLAKIPGLLNVAKGLKTTGTLGQKIGAATATSGLLGGAVGAGNSTASDTNGIASDVYEGAKTGAMWGAGGSTLGAGLGNIIKWGGKTSIMSDAADVVDSASKIGKKVKDVFPDKIAANIDEVIPDFMTVEGKSTLARKSADAAEETLMKGQSALDDLVPQYTKAYDASPNLNIIDNVSDFADSIGGLEIVGDENAAIRFVKDALNSELTGIPTPESAKALDVNIFRTRIKDVMDKLKSENLVGDKEVSANLKNLYNKLRFDLENNGESGKVISGLNKQYKSIIEPLQALAGKNFRYAANTGADLRSKEAKSIANSLFRAEGDSVTASLRNDDLKAIEKAFRTNAPDAADALQKGMDAAHQLSLVRSASTTGVGAVGAARTTLGFGAYGAGRLKGAVEGASPYIIPTLKGAFSSPDAFSQAIQHPNMQKIITKSKLLQTLTSTILDPSTSDAKRRAIQNILINNPIFRAQFKEEK